MKFHKVSKLCIVISVALGLAACSSTPKKAPVQSSKPMQAAPASVKTLNNEFGFLTDNSLTMEQLLALCTFYFEFNKTDLLGTNLLAVQAHGKNLSLEKSKKVLLKGYTDIQGSREYNIGLGYRRAKSVATTLMSQGATKQQIEMVSYGPEFPADAGNTEQAYQRNRRVDLVYCETASCKSVYGKKALKGSVK
jgi:peptidoglycan-associated lipoprotein